MRISLIAAAVRAILAASAGPGSGAALSSPASRMPLDAEFNRSALADG